MHRLTSRIHFSSGASTPRATTPGTATPEATTAEAHHAWGLTHHGPTTPEAQAGASVSRDMPHVRRKDPQGPAQTLPGLRKGKLGPQGCSSGAGKAIRSEGWEMPPPATRRVQFPGYSLVVNTLPGRQGNPLVTGATHLLPRDRAWHQ